NAATASAGRWGRTSNACRRPAAARTSSRNAWSPPTAATPATNASTGTAPNRRRAEHEGSRLGGEEGAGVRLFGRAARDAQVNVFQRARQRARTALDPLRALLQERRGIARVRLVAERFDHREHGASAERVSRQAREDRI